jgi:hypothetical protein
MKVHYSNLFPPREQYRDMLKGVIDVRSPDQAQEIAYIQVYVDDTVQVVFYYGHDDDPVLKGLDEAKALIESLPEIDWARA